MSELIISLAIIGVFFYIVSLIMEHKVKNFFNEKHQILWSLIMFISICLSGFMYSYNQSRSYNMVINFIIIIAALGGRIIFQRNRVYFLKKIDKKFIMENKSEIIRIIEDYKSKYIDSKSDITFADKIVFRNIIFYEIENNRIIAKVSGQMSHAGFPFTAVVKYDENLKVINNEVEDNELDK